MDQAESDAAFAALTGKLQDESLKARQAALLALLYCACGHPRGWHFVDGHACDACGCAGRLA